MAYQNRQPPEGINNVESGWQKDFILLVVGFFAGLALLTWLLVWLLGWSARWVPFSWEQALSRPLLQELETNPRRDYLQTLAEDLARAGGLNDHLAITVHYSDSETVNAYATLGGHVFILEGLLDEIDSEQGLAFVLAHEIAHIHYRHPLRAASRQLGFALFMSLVLGQNDIANLAASGGQLAMLDYSRAQEREADDWALEALYRHYGHVAGADGLFRYLAKQEDEAPPQWLSSHPNTRARIERLQQMSRERGYPTEGEQRPLPQW